MKKQKKSKIKKVQYRAKAKDGKMIVHPEDRQAMKAALKDHFDGKELIITFEIDYRKRSLGRNNFLWGYVYPILVEGFIQAGTDGLIHSPESYELIHEGFYKKKFVHNAMQMITSHGEVIDVAPSTTRQTNKEFDESLEECRRWAAEHLNVEIPYRGEKDLEQPDYAPKLYHWENQ